MCAYFLKYFTSSICNLRNIINSWFYKLKKKNDIHLQLSYLPRDPSCELSLSEGVVTDSNSMLYNYIRLLILTTISTYCSCINERTLRSGST